MKNLTTYLIGAGAALIIFLMIFIGGCKYGKTKCPIETTTTVYVHDTVTHTIIDKVPYYITHIDTIVKIQNVKIPVLPTKADTLKILESFYAKYSYTRNWKDSLLTATAIDEVTQNKITGKSFTYKILRPQEIIINKPQTILYDHYIDATLSYLLSNYKYTNIGLLYHWKRGSVGVSYAPGIHTAGQPFISSIYVQGGYTLFKIK